MSRLSDAVGSLDLTDDLPDGELVSDVIIITRLIHVESGQETFHLAINTGQTTIVQLGLINAAHRVISDGEWTRDEE